MSTTETHTIDLADHDDRYSGQWLKLKKHRTFVAAKRVEQALMGKGAIFEGGRRRPSKQGGSRRRGRGQGGDIRLTVSLVDYAAALIEEFVVDWRVLGIDGEKLPLGRLGVESEQASEDAIETVIEAIEDYYDLAAGGDEDAGEPGEEKGAA